jgi:hypothetical protein
MKITKHITFFYIPERIQYINRIIDETNTYMYRTDIFIHTNNNSIPADLFHIYTNGSINLVYHDLSGIHPFLLTWSCRDLLKNQKDDYDIFMYIEDDILVPKKALEYWLKYNEDLISESYNLGFVRIETYNNEEYITDLYGEQMDRLIKINGVEYCINDKNPYCAFWIYNKDEFNNFINSRFYYLESIPKLYDIRELSAFGLHGNGFPWYINTVIPIENGILTDACKIYHMPNNYVDGGTKFATIKFKDAVKFR